MRFILYLKYKLHLESYRSDRHYDCSVNAALREINKANCGFNGFGTVFIACFKPYW